MTISHFLSFYPYSLTCFKVQDGCSKVQEPVVPWNGIHTMFIYFVKFKTNVFSLKYHVDVVNKRGTIHLSLKTM